MAVPAKNEQEEADAAGDAAANDQGFVAAGTIELRFVSFGTFHDKCFGFINALVSVETNRLISAPAKRAPHALPKTAGIRWRDATVLDARSEITKYSATDEVIYIINLSASYSWIMILRYYADLSPTLKALYEIRRYYIPIHQNLQWEDWLSSPERFYNPEQDGKTYPETNNSPKQRVKLETLACKIQSEEKRDYGNSEYDRSHEVNPLQLRSGCCAGKIGGVSSRYVQGRHSPPNEE